MQLEFHKGTFFDWNERSNNVASNSIKSHFGNGMAFSFGILWIEIETDLFPNF